jgi:hypothetical protein
MRDPSQNRCRFEDIFLRDFSFPLLQSFLLEMQSLYRNDLWLDD